MDRSHNNIFLSGLSQVFLILVLGLPSTVTAFDLVEFDIDVTISDPVKSFDYQLAAYPNTGFTLYNLNELSLNVKSSFFPNFGLLPGEDLQNGFVLYDGTLALEVNEVDQQGIRRLYTTYRIDVDARRLQPRYLRNLFVRQGRYDDVRARARARAAQLSDARIMRFVEDGTGGGRWIRAVRRVSDPRADVRFMPRQSPDGVPGHYGYDVKSDGAAYVWAVVDKNSRYAVGLNVDNDDDGVFNADDNCRDVPNSDQMDVDADGQGNACDADDDNDSILDPDDNCPLAANPLQIDTDSDGLGDACDTDDDNDSVNDGLDQCPGTAPDSVVDSTGCSISDLCPCDNLSGWRNHGAYVSCVARNADSFFDDGIISPEVKEEIISGAGQSTCGKR